MAIIIICIHHLGQTMETTKTARFLRGQLGRPTDSFDQIFALNFIESSRLEFKFDRRTRSLVVLNVCFSHSVRFVQRGYCRMREVADGKKTALWGSTVKALKSKIKRNITGAIISGAICLTVEFPRFQLGSFLFVELVVVNRLGQNKKTNQSIGQSMSIIELNPMLIHWHLRNHVMNKCN